MKCSTIFRLPLLSFLTAIAVFPFLVLPGCSQPKRISKAATQAGTRTLHCILLGNDSAAIYYGTSGNMEQPQKGRLSDPTFIDPILKGARGDSTCQVRIKPVAGAELEKDFRTLVDKLNLYELGNRATDTLDARESSFFHVLNVPDFLESKRSPNTIGSWLQDPDDSKLEVPASSKTFTIFLLGKDQLYAYKGTGQEKGQLYTYVSLLTTLSSNKKQPYSCIRIIPSPASSYKNGVDILDLMTQCDVKEYRMISGSGKEQAYMEELNKK